MNFEETEADGPALAGRLLMQLCIFRVHFCSFITPPGCARSRDVAARNTTTTNIYYKHEDRDRTDQRSRLLL